MSDRATATIKEGTFVAPAQTKGLRTGCPNGNRVFLHKAPVKIGSSRFNVINEEFDMDLTSLIVDELYGSEEDPESVYGRYKKPFEN